MNRIFSFCSWQNLSSHHPCSADCVQTRPRPSFLWSTVASLGGLFLLTRLLFCSSQLLVTHPLRFIFEFCLWRYYQMSTRVYYFLLSDTGACFSCDWILDNGVWFRRLCPLTSLGSVQGKHELGYEELSASDQNPEWLCGRRRLPINPGTPVTLPYHGGQI